MFRIGIPRTVELNPPTLTTAPRAAGGAESGSFWMGATACLHSLGTGLRESLPIPSLRIPLGIPRKGPRRAAEAVVRVPESPPADCLKQKAEKEECCLAGTGVRLEIGSELEEHGPPMYLSNSADARASARPGFRAHAISPVQAGTSPMDRPMGP